MENYTARYIIVIFGAAVKPDGGPSGTLLRRVLSAIEISKECENTLFITSGAVGKYGAAEASVIESILLDHSIPSSQIVKDVLSFDTLQSIVNCAHIIKNRFLLGDKIIVCTSSYHIPRCVILFRIIGVEAKYRKVLSDNGKVPNRKLLYFHAREIPATLWDILLLCFRIAFGKITRICL